MNIFNSKLYRKYITRSSRNLFTNNNNNNNNNNDDENNESLTSHSSILFNMEQQASLSDDQKTSDDNVRLSLDSDDDDDNDNNNIDNDSNSNDTTTETSVEEKGNENENANGTLISIETVTIPTIYNILWIIDEDSLNYAGLKNKNKSSNDNNNDDNNNNIDDRKDSQRGILDATFTKNGISFKLELCLSGWKNSSRGYCAFYLTIPQKKIPQQLIARYTVKIKNTMHQKQSSIRDDYYLGVGFPNFCAEESLLESQINNQLELNVKIEIFQTESKVKNIEQELYKKFVKKFSVICNKSLLKSKCKNNNNNLRSNKLLIKMYKDKSFCDVIIKCKTLNNEMKLISVHKCVLIHSSLVFQKMFNDFGGSNNSFIESHKNEINLENSLWSYFIIKNMIKFLYFGEINNEIIVKNVEYLFELFCIAEYYEITSLITECCNQFILNLTPSNVCFLLLNLENKFNHVKQIQFIKNNNILWRYMIKHIKKVKKTQYYNQILHNSPYILNTLIDKMT